MLEDFAEDEDWKGLALEANWICKFPGVLEFDMMQLPTKHEKTKMCHINRKEK